EVVQTILLRARGDAPILRVRIDAPQDEALLVQVCFLAPPDRPKPTGPRLPGQRAPSTRGNPRAVQLAAEFHERAATRDAQRPAILAEARAAAMTAPPPGLARTAAGSPPILTPATAPDQVACFRALKLPLHVDTKRRAALKLDRRTTQAGARL